jgi:tRNA A-37 threonylcarbamoyl transferase component Bud32
MSWSRSYLMHFKVCLHHSTCMILYCAIAAHHRASELGILHRDISVGNIINVKGTGFLIDWELAKDTQKPDARASERTVSPSHVNRC